MADIISKSAISLLPGRICRACGYIHKGPGGLKMADFMPKCAVETSTRTVRPTSVASSTDFAFDGSEDIPERCLDVAWREPNLLNAVHVCEQLGSLFYQCNCPPEAQSTLKKA